MKCFETDFPTRFLEVRKFLLIGNHFFRFHVKFFGGYMISPPRNIKNDLRSWHVWIWFEFVPEIFFEESNLEMFPFFYGWLEDWLIVFCKQVPNLKRIPTLDNICGPFIFMTYTLGIQSCSQMMIGVSKFLEGDWIPRDMKTLPETNSEFTPENGCLEDDSKIRFGAPLTFHFQVRAVSVVGAQVPFFAKSLGDRQWSFW